MYIGYRLRPYYFVLVLLAAVYSGWLQPTTAYAEPSENFERQVRELLQKRPDIVLDVLREHSEIVLEIAQQGSMLRKRKGMLAQWEQDAKIPKKLDVRQAPVRGQTNTPVTIIGFTDFTCGFCRQADASVVQLLEKYQSEVRFVFCPLPKEDFELSVTASRYALAAFMQDTQKGWRYYDALFAGADTLERDGEEFLNATAVRVGLNVKKLVQDAKGKNVQEMLAQFRDEANRYDIQGTPYFFVNNLIIRGAVPKELFEEAIDMALRLKRK